MMHLTQDLDHGYSAVKMEVKPDLDELLQKDFTEMGQWTVPEQFSDKPYFVAYRSCLLARQSAAYFFLSQQFGLTDNTEIAVHFVFFFPKNNIQLRPGETDYLREFVEELVQQENRRLCQEHRGKYILSVRRPAPRTMIEDFLSQRKPYK